MTIKELFPDMSEKKRLRLGKMIKEQGIQCYEKVEVTHYENSYSDEDFAAITLLAAQLGKNE